MKVISYSRQSINQDDIDAVCAVLRSDWLTQGPKVREFEEALAEQCGAKHCVAVANGTTALHLACMAIGVQSGDVGLTSPISFLASANCIVYCGGKVNFVDIDPRTLCLSVEKVEEYCKSNSPPKVVIPVDFAGVPADLPQLKRLADTYDFKIIEDAAHAIGSTYTWGNATYSCGSCAHTDLAIFSFHPVKTITTGEGGAVLTNDDELFHRVRCLASHGMERDPLRFRIPNSEFRIPESFPGWYYEMQALGFNSRITDIQCALGLSQLKRLHQFKTRRQEIVNIYNRGFLPLAEKGLVILPPWPEGTDPCYHLYTLQVGAKCKVGRDELFRRLRDMGIYCQVHYIPIYRQPYYRERFGYAPDPFLETEKYYSSCLSLPLFPDVDQEALNHTLDAIFHLVQ